MAIQGLGVPRARHKIPENLPRLPTYPISLSGQIKGREIGQFHSCAEIPVNIGTLMERGTTIPKRQYGKTSLVSEEEVSEYWLGGESCMQVPVVDHGMLSARLCKRVCWSSYIQWWAESAGPELAEIVCGYNFSSSLISVSNPHGAQRRLLQPSRL